MDSARVGHAPRSAGAPSDAQSSALARIYARALQRYQEKQTAEGSTPEPNGRDDTERPKNDRTAAENYTG